MSDNSKQLTNNSNNQLPVIHKAKNLKLSFPENKSLEPKEQDRIKGAILKGGIVPSDGRGYLDKRVLPQILATDKKGATKVYNNAVSEDKFENGSEEYLTLSATKKEIDKRIQEPRSAIVREKLRYSEECLNTFRDAPELEKERQIESERINADRPKVTARKLKAENITNCQLTGEKFDNDAVGHHIERVADKPRNARDLDNVVAVKDRIHLDIHGDGAESKEELLEYAKKRGYNIPENLK